jgi:hypothetical protein
VTESSLPFSPGLYRRGFGFFVAYWVAAMSSNPTTNKNPSLMGWFMMRLPEELSRKPERHTVATQEFQP